MTVAIWRVEVIRVDGPHSVTLCRIKSRGVIRAGSYEITCEPMTAYLQKGYKQTAIIKRPYQRVEHRDKYLMTILG